MADVGAILQGIEAAAKLLPAVGGAIAGLIKLGMGADEAAEIVRRDITSRAAAYERMRAEDLAALRAKWAQPAPPALDAMRDAVSRMSVPPSPFLDPEDP